MSSTSEDDGYPEDMDQDKHDDSTEDSDTDRSDAESEGDEFGHRDDSERDNPEEKKSGACRVVCLGALTQLSPVSVWFAVAITLILCMHVFVHARECPCMPQHICGGHGWFSQSTMFVLKIQLEWFDDKCLYLLSQFTSLAQDQL